MAEQNDIIQKLLSLIQGGGQDQQPRNEQEILTALTNALGLNQNAAAPGGANPSPAAIPGPTGPNQEPGGGASPAPGYTVPLQYIMGGYGGDRGFSTWAPPSTPQGEQGFFGAMGQIEAANVQAAARAYTEPMSAFVREVLSARGAQDTRKVEGYEKRKTELGERQEATGKFDDDGNPIYKNVTGIDANNPFGSGTIAAQAYAEMAKAEKEAGLKTGTLNADGTFSGGTIDAETQAALKLEQEKQKEIGLKGTEERLSLEEKARLARLNMREHGDLLDEYGAKALSRLSGPSGPESVLAQMFMGSNHGSPQGTNPLANAANMFDAAGRGAPQQTAMGMLSGNITNPYTAPVHQAQRMVGGGNNINQLQGMYNAQTAGNLGASQQYGQNLLGAGQNLFGQFNPQIANQYGMQRPFAAGAGQTIGAKGQALGNVIGGIGNIGAAV